MRWLAVVSCLPLMLFAACEQQPLPLPTPAQRDLEVLVQDGPLTYATDDTDKVVGLEHDLIEAFAQEMGVGVTFRLAPPREIQSNLTSGKAHFAASWFSPSGNEKQKVTLPFLWTNDVLVQHEASLPITDISKLTGRTVHVMAGSRQTAALHALQARVPDLTVVEYKKGTVFDLLEDLGQRELELALVDGALLQIALQFEPFLQTSLVIGEPQPIVWLFGENPNTELLSRASAFIERVQNDGTLERLKDRYLGHVRRLRQEDVARFIERTETVLPRLRSSFHAAQAATGLDWRLIAALAYQESQWDPNATSPTNVRGIMMLTEETADRLGVSNRLDARESILAGARYLGYLRDQLAPSTPEPDRTWLALAAYNLGAGHLNAARTLAKQQNANPDSWYEMKRFLPLLAQPKYYQRLKSGPGRGGEAVILAENIRSYYDILTRYEEPYRGTPELPRKLGGAASGLNPASQGTGLKRR